MSAMSRIKYAAPNDLLWSQITVTKLLIELEYLENFKSRTILKALINLKSIVGYIIAIILGSMAIASISAGRLKIYLIRIFKLLSLFFF